MKKFLPYILILVVMFGFFGTTNKVNAQVVNGKCVSTSTYGDGTPEVARK